jgi:CubicO group peptidase (beta-lactamase class C family)
MVAGEVASGFEPVREAFEKAQATDEGGAQLAVYRHGRLVVDLWAGDDPITGRPFTGDSLTILMSVSKGLVGTCANLLRERGMLDVDAPVAEYWPEFAAAGKDRITVAHLLSHRAGLSEFDPDAGIIDFLDWDRCVTALAEMTPLWQPAAYFRYHPLTHGYLIGEVIRRVTGTTVGRFFATEIAEPLALDLGIGLAEAEEHRFVPQFTRSTAPTGTEVTAELAAVGVDVTSRLARAVVNSVVTLNQSMHDLNARPAHAVELPAVNGIGNARSLARMYAATIGEVDGVRLLRPDTVDRAIVQLNDGLGAPPPLDLLPDNWPMRAALGWELSRGMTPMLGEGSFGHAGAGGRIGFAHPELGVAVGYVCTNMAWDTTAGADPRWLPWTAALHDVLS